MPHFKDGMGAQNLDRFEHRESAVAKNVVPLGLDGVTWRPLAVDENGRLQIDVIDGGSTSTTFDDGDAVDTDSQGTLVMGATAVPGVAHPIKVAADGAVQVDIESLPNVTINEPVTVDAVNLDIRDLSSASDSVSAVVTSSALPTGAATEAKQDVGNTSLSVLDDWDETNRAAVNLIASQVGVQGNAGAVSANTLRVALATDANTVAGNLAHDAAISSASNPVVAGFEADNSIRPAVSADQDISRAWVDRNGRPVTTQMYPGEQKTKVTSFNSTSTAAVTDDPASTAKIVVYAITVFNTSATKAYVDFKDGSGGTTKWSLPCAADMGGACITFPDGLPMTADNPMHAVPSAAVTNIIISVLFKEVTV